ncbi:recombinase family protein [Psychrobacillus psychrodurans]|uniref:recombinase family protein n=1 Tax=Psychrobacillus psychrodurans TaxID=126157 RepID=UPI001F4D70CF|nr:recombinase family protein [Psychrobacillus psychrodurans]MCK1998324.1 recombinase family protein [Psychrobacillus psychrodurans]
MEQRKFGYGRVSSKEQNEARQIDSLQSIGVSQRDLYVDKASGKDFDREQYQIMKRAMREGDVLYVHSLDRLGRNKDDILAEWQEITKVIKADIVVLDMPLLDTTKHKDSVGTFVADLVLQVLSWIAQDERERIGKRQREGIDAAKRRGQHLGRPKKSYDTMTDVEQASFISEYTRWKAEEQTAVQTFNALGLTKSTFYKIVREYESEIGKS